MKLHFAKKNTQTSGFTLVEALVATSILAVSITALVNVVAQNVFTSGFVKNKAVAMSLAQEGVELVRNIQDTALLNNSYATFELLAGTVFSPCTYGAGVCTIDPASLSIQSCSGQECPPLKISENGYFNYIFEDTTNSLNEKFTRSISIVQTGSDSGKVVVTVSWLQGSTQKEVVYETDLFLWIQ